MTDATPAGAPIQIELLETERRQRDTVIVRLSGRWRGHGRAHEGQELLVVQLDDRRHRFPAMPEERRAAIARPGAWSARFMLPDWSKPGPGWEASLLIGDAVIPVPGPHLEAEAAAAAEPVDVFGADAPSEAVLVRPALEPEPSPALEPELPPALESELGAGIAEDPRSGPLSKLLLRDTIVALHAELELAHVHGH